MVPEMWSTTDRTFCHVWLFFAFYPPNNLENQNFEIMKKTPGDIIFLHMCTKGDIKMLYGSHDMECNRHNFLFFWPIFCPFTLVSWSYFILWVLNSMIFAIFDYFVPAKHFKTRKSQN